MRALSFLFGMCALVSTTEAIAQSGVSEAEAQRRDAEQQVADLRARHLEDPENSDLLRRLATAEAAAGDLVAAQAAIDRAATLAPDDNDVLLARARILFWSGNVPAAREQLEVVSARDPSYPELAQLAETLAGADQGSRMVRGGLAVSAGISEIEFERGGTSTWRSFGASAFAWVDPLSTVSGTVDYERRAVSDVRIGILGDRQIGTGRVFLALAVTPSADFREKYSIGVGGELQLLKSLDLLLELRHADYGVNEVNTIRPGVRLRATPRLTLTGQGINLFQKEGGGRTGFSGRLDYQLGEGTGLFLGAATYPDTESGVTRQVRSAFLGGTIPLSDRVTLRGGAEYERRDSSYKRKAVTVGLGWRFGA